MRYFSSVLKRTGGTPPVLVVRTNGGFSPISLAGDMKPSLLRMDPMDLLPSDTGHVPFHRTTSVARAGHSRRNLQTISTEKCHGRSATGCQDTFGM